MNKNFEYAVNFVLKNEGGYVDHPDDRGGATNFGITQDTLARYLNNPVSKDDVKNMSIDLAKEIYKANYWDALSLDNVDHMILATIVFDQGVNFGISAAAKRLQRILGVTADGMIGPKTLAAIEAKDGRHLAADFVKQSQLAYAHIVRRNRSQAVFIVGWIARSHKLWDLLI